MLGGEELNDISQRTISYEASKDLILVHTVQLKPVIKAGISDVVIASVHSEKTRLKKLMTIMMIIIMNKSQKMKVFSGRQKLTSAMKLRPEK